MNVAGERALFRRFPADRPESLLPKKNYGACSSTSPPKGENVKIIPQIALSLVFLGAGFAAGFPVGKDAGFTTGSEWALMQANLLAREAGVFMPVSLEQGQFRVVVKQPRGLYKRAWHLADAKEEQVPWLNSGELALSETVQRGGRVSMTP